MAPQLQAFKPKIGVTDSLLFQDGGRGDEGRRTGSAAECEPDGGCARTPQLPEGDRGTCRDV